jgi:hypothetical protein
VRGAQLGASDVAWRLLSRNLRNPWRASSIVSLLSIGST